MNRAGARILTVFLTVVVSATVAIWVARHLWALQQEHTYEIMLRDFFPDHRLKTGHWPHDLEEVEAYAKTEYDWVGPRYIHLQRLMEPRLKVLQETPDHFVARVNYGWSLGGFADFDLTFDPPKR